MFLGLGKLNLSRCTGKLPCDENIMKTEKQEKRSVKPFVGEVEGGIYIETSLSRFYSWLKQK